MIIIKNRHQSSNQLCTKATK